MKNPTVTNMTDVQLGANLRILREKSAMSNVDLGKKADISAHQLQKYELGINRISAITVLKLSQALDEPIESFFAT